LELEFYLAEGQRLAHTGSWVFNPAGFEYWSRELFHIHGLDPAKEAPSLEEYLALVHPEDRDFMASLVKRIVEEPSGFDVTKRIIRPNGEVGYVRGVGTPVVENGTLKRFIGTGVDVTEHELLTQELRRREAYLAELFEKAPEALALMDLRDVVVRMNPEFSRIFGYSSEEAVGRPLNELVAPSDLRDEAEEFTKQVTGRGETLNVESVRARKDGSRLPVSIIGMPISLAGSQVAEYAIYRDITERKRAEEELKQLVDLVPQLIVVLGPDGNWIYANRVAQEYTGLNLDEYRSVDVIGRVIHPDDAEKMRAEREHAFAGSDPFELEARLLGKDGVYRWFLFRYNPLVGQGRVRRWYTSATEIELRKQEEERVRKENVRLEERTRIAQELHDTLLQTFLSASMQISVAVSGVTPDSMVKPRLDRILQIMNQGIEVGRNTIRGLRSSDSHTLDLVLALSRVQQELSAQHDIDFCAIVAGRQQPLQSPIGHEIYRIGREALVNAFRHSRAKRVEFELDYAENDLRMCIRDNGCGIDPQVLEAGREGHWGLAGMRERATRIGGLFNISGSASAVTEVRLSIPSSLAFQLCGSRDSKECVTHSFGALCACFNSIALAIAGRAFATAIFNIRPRLARRGSSCCAPGGRG